MCDPFLKNPNTPGWYNLLLRADFLTHIIYRHACAGTHTHTHTHTHNTHRMFVYLSLYQFNLNAVIWNYFCLYVFV